jgi:DNA polymerase-3 subunit delta
MSAAPHHEGGIPAPAYLVTGEDAALVSQELSSLLGELTKLTVLGDVIVEEYTQSTQDDPLPIGAVLDACRTPPFLSEMRLIVVRDGANLDAAQTKEVISYLKEPLTSTVLIFVVGGKSATPTLRKAFSAIGYVISAQPGTNARSRDEWFADHLVGAPIRFDASALSLLKTHLGEDVSRVEGILGALGAAYGPGAMIRADELEPFLGSEGSVAPWDLTDAIDQGDTQKALNTLARMMEAGERHPLQIIATLHRHIAAMLRLDGEDSFGETEAASAVGMSTFPATKALRQARKLGHDNIARAVTLLGEADLDLRGRVAWPPELVMEVLVARLSRLTTLRPNSVSPGTSRQQMARR